MNSFENVKNQINNMITNPTTITYGCLGVSTALLGYYTFFKSNDDSSSFSEKESDSLFGSMTVPETIIEEPEPEPEPEPVVEPESEQTGGKKKKSTKRRKHKNKNKKNSTLRR
jgi:hypothetical protein